MLEINPQLKSQIFDSLLMHMKAGRAGSPTSIPAAIWSKLASDLRRIGLSKTSADALISWANTQAEQSCQTPIKIRVLHPMEREFISVEAYDYLLDLYRLGLIGPPQFEMLIENCAFLTSLPASRDQIQKLALRSFSESLEAQGFGVSH